MPDLIPSLSVKEQTDVKKHEIKIMLKLADILLQDNLITPEENYHLKQLIESGGSI